MWNMAMHVIDPDEPDKHQGEQGERSKRLTSTVQLHWKEKYMC